MKKIIVLLVLLNSSLFAQMQFVYQWVDPLMSSTGNGVGEAVVTDSNGDVYVAGYFSGQLNFNPMGTSTTVSSAGGQDAYVAKYNSSGSLIWAFKLGSTGTDNAYGLALDNSGNLLVCGTYSGTVDFDPSTSVNALTSVTADIFVAKYSSSGTYIWAAGMGATGGGKAMEVSVDGSNNVYTTGYFGGTVDFDPGVGTYTLASVGAGDAFISKLSSSGTFVWAKSFGGTSVTNGNSIAVDIFSNVYVSGVYYGTVDFNPGAGTNTFTSNGSSDLFVSKFDASGNFLWVTPAGSTSSEGASGVTADKSGNVVVTGYFSGSVDFDPGVGTNFMSSAGNRDIFIWKLTTSGTFLWSQNIGSSAVDEGVFVTTDIQRNIYTTGSFSGSNVDFNPGAGVIWLSSPNSSTNSFILKLDSVGNYRAVMGLGGNGAEDSRAVAVDGNYSVYSMGQFQQGTDFNPTGASYSVTPPNGITPYLHKMCQTPQSPSAISGSTVLCVGSPAVFSVTPVSQASYYIWLNPTVWSGSSATSTIALTATSSVVNGFISVSAANACGASYLYTMAVQSVSLPTVTVNSGTLCAGQSFTLVPAGAVTYTFSGGSAVVSPVLSTTYQVVGSNSLGCISSPPAVANITVSPAPVVAVSSGTICSGNSFTLSPGGAVSYTYSSGTPVVSPVLTTSYSITATTSLGCVSTTPAVATVSVFNYPLPAIAVSGGTVCQGDIFVIQPSGAATYTFSGGSASVTPTSSTTYSVSGMSSQGCITTAPTTLMVTVLPRPVFNLTSGAVCIGNSFTIVPTGASTFTFVNGGPVVSPVVTTNYSVIATGSNGCVSSQPSVATVTVSSLPIISASGGTVCEGGTFVIQPSGAATYTFSGGSASVTPAVSTVYTVSGTSSQGCISATPVTLTVAVNPLPTISVSATQSLICTGDGVVLIAAGANSYTWNTGESAGTITTVAVPGAVSTVTATNLLGCKNSASYSMTVSDCLGIKKEGESLMINIFPNPSRGDLKITFTTGLQGGIVLLNALGQKLNTFVIDRTTDKIQIENLAAGIYYLRISLNDEEVMRKVIVQ